MIHRLTGGRWGEIAAPVIEPAAAAVPLLVVLAIPLFIAVPILYHGRTVRLRSSPTCCRIISTRRRSSSAPAWR